MANRCPKCNADNPDTKQFCGDCGTQLPASVEISSSHTKTLLTPAKDPIKGTTFAGRYQLIEELGRGGMGVVYKAEDKKLKRTVALKFLPPELTHIPDVKDRFMREAQAAAALDHPNICTVYEFDEAEEKTFISMAYVEGPSLRKKLESGPLELDEALRIATQIAQGLQIAHKKGIVHRDIKSANIMVTEDNQAKIMDFGLARMTGGTLITQEGMTMGTVAYMSPEQAQGEEVDHRSDIWSLGVVLYEMFGGQLPFKGGQDQAVVYSILNKKPRPLAELRSEIPVSIGQVVDKALEKNPDERYQQIDELLDDLKSISAGIVPEEIKVRLRKAKMRRRKRTILYAVAAGLVIVVVVIALNLFMGGRVEAIESIAVLPFENLTGDAGQEYFVDGATDEVIGQLSKIGAWRVISRTSVMHYKGVDKPLAEIARELNVDAVVEGTVYQTGENVRIGIKLIDVIPEEQNLWADTYDRPMTDLRIMYSEIARTVADKTKVNLTADELTRLTSASQVNPESYDAYLKGRTHWYRFTPAEFELALQYFDLALQLDPNNALAHLGIAQVWGSRYQMGRSTREAFPLAKAAAERALELDNTMAEVHYWLSGIRGWGEWDWKSAETGFQQAFKLNPNFPDTHAWYSHLLSHMGRADEALPYIERALELDPLNPTFHALYGVVLVYNRRFDEGLAAARRAFEMEPLNGIARGALQWALLAKKMYAELLAYFREERFKNPKLLAALEVGFEEAGYNGAFRALADTLAELYIKPVKWVRAWDISNRYLEAGDYDLAIDWLEKAYLDHEPNLPYISLPVYEPLRSDPRFQDLLRKMNLPVDEKE